MLLRAVNGLVNIMDAYVLGALPPYNALLGGKLMACLIRSRDIYDDFTKGLSTARICTGIISHQEKKSAATGRHYDLFVHGTPHLVYIISLKLGGVEAFLSDWLHRRLGSLPHTRQPL